MFVYANLLGNWTELTDDDTINGCPPVVFIESVLLADNSYENFKINNEFVDVTINHDVYSIHKSCIQVTKKI